MTLKELFYTYIMGIRPNNKLWYYTKAVWSTLMPHWWCRMWRKRLMAAYDRMTDEEKREIDQRVDYYCLAKVIKPLPPVGTDIAEYIQTPYYHGQKVKTIGEHNLWNKDCHSVYFFDTYRYTRSFGKSLKWIHATGDVYYACCLPSICKSRPKGPKNNVLINQDKVRHFIFIHDPFRWEEKQPIVLFRGAAKGKTNRQKFIEMFADAGQMFDVKDVCRDSINPPEWRDMKGMSMYQHLKYRYIMCLEGNDVATNLKWVMSSNSIAIMPKPTVESWFMEGLLIPDYHYICIADDYHDLEDKIRFYEAHPEEAKNIVEHAHQWCSRFASQTIEDLVALRTFEKYFRITQQITNK